MGIIDVAQRTGLSLAEISRLFEAGENVSEAVREIASRRLPDIELLLENARHLRDWVEAAQGCDCPSLESCGLFSGEALSGMH